MSAPVQYHDRHAERSLLGDLMNLPGRVTEVSQAVLPEDFYEPGHAATYAAILELHRDGHPPTAEAVRQHLGADLTLIGGSSGLADMLSAAAGAPRKSAQTIREWATARRIRSACAEVLDSLDVGVDPGVVLDQAGALLAGIDAPTATLPADLLSFDQLMDQPAEDRPPWAVPGLLRVGWRAVVVATEGQGKSVLFRQFAILAAQGIHPLTFKPMDPCPTLLVDLENPSDAITETAKPIRAEARRRGEYHEHEAWLWARPGGVDLRSRRGRAEFEAVIAEVRPRLVCMGPLYKAYHVAAKESDEQAASEVQSVLDDLRTRYGFALLLEHHAPKGSGGVRELLPYGSSFWLRWPEFGLKLVPEMSDPTGRRLTLGRWRADRLKAAWPDAIERGGQFPWTGVYANGI